MIRRMLSVSAVSGHTCLHGEYDERGAQDPRGIVPDPYDAIVPTILVAIGAVGPGVKDDAV